MHRQVSQERFDLRFGGEEVLAPPHAVEADESCDPLHRGALGGHGVLVQTEHRVNFIAECGFWVSRRVRPIIPPWWCPEIADNRHWAKLPENPTNIIL